MPTHSALALKRASLTAIIVMSGVCLGSSPVLAATVELPVPYVSQVPTGAWVAPWDEACEEASITMIHGYYTERTNIPVAEGREEMQGMIDWEKAVFQNYQDTDAEQTLDIIHREGTFEARIVRHPTVEAIKAELDARRPVIFLVNMYTLYGERDLKDSYHVGVISGYDDATQEFILQDPARAKHRYGYDRVMSALHDYQLVSKEADGVPTVIFTNANDAPMNTSGFFSRVLQFFRNLF